MNKTPTTLIIMDGFGLRQETEGNAIRAAATPRLDQFFQEYAHTTLPGLRPGRGPAGRADGQQRGGPHQHRRRPGGVPGPAPDHQGHRRRRASYENPAYLHAMDACLEKGTVPAPDGPAVRRRRPLPHRPPVRPAAAWRSDRGLEQVYIHAFLDGRDVSPTSGAGLCGPDRGKVPGDRRGQDRHGHGPVLRHGPGQALGPGGGGL